MAAIQTDEVRAVARKKRGRYSPGVRHLVVSQFIERCCDIGLSSNSQNMQPLSNATGRHYDLFRFRGRRQLQD